MCLSQGEAVVRQRLSGRMAMGLMTVEGKQGEGDARGTCCTGASDLTLGLHQAGEAGGSDTERHGGGTA